MSLEDSKKTTVQAYILVLAAFGIWASAFTVYECVTHAYRCGMEPDMLIYLLLISFPIFFTIAVLLHPIILHHKLHEKTDRNKRFWRLIGFLLVAELLILTLPEIQLTTAW